MPSPIGHSLAGLCGFAIARRQVAPRHRPAAALASVVIANLADLDVVPGLLWFGDPRVFHHQASHSLAAALAVAGLGALIARHLRIGALRLGLWAGAVYGSHLLLDLFGEDPSAPFGLQLLWPASLAYLLAPVPAFARFDYYDPALGMIGAMLSAGNLDTILRELSLLLPALCLAWWLGGRGQSHA